MHVTCTSENRNALSRYVELQILPREVVGRRCGNQAALGLAERFQAMSVTLLPSWQSLCLRLQTGGMRGVRLQLI